MLEITVIAASGDTRALKVFQFENDALQAFLTECSANETGCQLTSLRALGVPLTVTGEIPKLQPKAEPKAKVNEPITRTAGPGSVRSAVPTEQPAIKPKTEKL